MKRLGNVLLLHILMCLGQTVHGSEIINGRKVPENSMLYMVSVQKNGHHECGGFLINEYFVVTAAHCGGDDLKYVLLGNQNLKSSKMKKIQVNSTCKPKDYVDIANGNDIMLLQLSEKVPLNNTVNKIPLPTYEITLRENQTCSVAGWGKVDENSSGVDDLRVVNVSIINSSDCNKKWEGYLPPNVICAGGYGTNKGFCQGDSGGPLVCNGRAVGVVSFNRGFSCHYPDVPNVYTNISKYLQWINKILNEKKCV
ncbi:mast cell protease 1A-like [Girardinichthys multiradiatus]|uniref:mast cell protease 1A-like n=1 Tax=Girardinichthys multiradiatus TaxID=208333 RepID=UPI001FABE082|nr:mast cell protease 1A-like [Girardinichthys multiradiatus]